MAATGGDGGTGGIIACHKESKLFLLYYLCSVEHHSNVIHRKSVLPSPSYLCHNLDPSSRNLNYLLRERALLSSGQGIIDMEMRIDVKEQPTVTPSANRNDPYLSTAPYHP
jgi:hypothetical protein